MPYIEYVGYTLPETNSKKHLKIDAWKMKFPFGAQPIFQGFSLLVFRECI